MGSFWKTNPPGGVLPQTTAASRPTRLWWGSVAATTTSRHLVGLGLENEPKIGGYFVSFHRKVGSFLENEARFWGLRWVRLPWKQKTMFAERGRRVRSLYAGTTERGRPNYQGIRAHFSSLHPDGKRIHYYLGKGIHAGPIMRWGVGNVIPNR